MIANRYKRLLKRYLFLLIPYTLLRVGFYFYHLKIYRQFNQNEIFESFISGIRFDIAAICLLNVPTLLLSLFPSNNKKFSNFERWVFILLNSLGILASIDDYELFLFMGKRLSFDLFYITDDIFEQLPQITMNYWYLPIVAVAFGVWFYFFDKKNFSLIKEKKENYLVSVLVWVLLAGASFVGIRGGIQHKSINVQSAFTQGKNELGHLVLNTPYHFLRTLGSKPILKMKFFGTDDEAKKIVLNLKNLKGGIQGRLKANVVLIILESFSQEYVEKGYAPFLSELKKKGVSFERHLANGRRSIEALPSLLCGLPSLLEEPISKSRFQGNNYVCFPRLLKNAGYTNYFFHGGTRGTMGFEAYTLSKGFDRYFSKDDYPDEKDDDGNWGIYDGPYLQYVAKTLGEMKEPFMAGVFTLSSHQPYKIRGSFPKGTLEIHESIGYADQSLKEFFATARTQPWFKNTIFFITSDHTQKLETKKFETMVGRYRVPLIVYAPGFDWDKDLGKKVTQHSDIPSSVLDFVEVSGEDLAGTSNSIFAIDDGAALNLADGRSYMLVTNKSVTSMTRNFEEQDYFYDWDTGELKEAGKSNATELKAYLQYFINGLINNNLSLYR